MTFAILGAAGFLGRNLVRDLAANGEVIAYARRPGAATNLRDFATWEDDLARAGGATVVNTIAVASHAACEADPATCDATNHVLAAAIGATCKARGWPLIHIGTDGLYCESAPGAAPAYHRLSAEPTPRNAYARSKRAAERALEALDWGAALRTSFVGSDCGTGRGLVAFLAQRVRAGATELTGYADVWFTPVHASQLATRIAEIAERGDARFALHNVASTPAQTKAAFLRSVASAANVSVSVTDASGLGGAYATPADQSLYDARAFPFGDVVERCARDLRDALR